MRNETKTISLKVDLEFHRRLKLYVAGKGITIKDLFINYVEELIKMEDEKKKKMSEK